MPLETIADCSTSLAAPGNERGVNRVRRWSCRPPARPRWAVVLGEPLWQTRARIPLSSRELGSTEIYANGIVHFPNGRFVTVVGDGDLYIIQTAHVEGQGVWTWEPRMPCRKAS